MKLGLSATARAQRSTASVRIPNAEPGLALDGRRRLAVASSPPRGLGLGLGGAARLAGGSDRSARVITNVASTGGDAPKSLDEVDDLELARTFRRSVFTPVEWKKHRSADRYNRNILTMVNSRIVRSIAGPMTITFGISTVAAIEDHLQLLSTYFPEFDQYFHLPLSPFSLTGFSLGLLLVFRTNSAYGRWWEARKLWGLLLNRSRDITRQALGYMTSPNDAALQDVVLRYTMALSKSLFVHLRAPEDEDLAKECKDILPADELEELLASPHRPNYCLQVMCEAVARSDLSDIQKQTMDHNLTTFADVVGACERILRTPIPLAYTRHTARALVIWLTFLPIAIVHDTHFAAIPISCMITFLLIGIEELGMQIEEPFSILPLEVIAGTAETNITALDKNHGVVTRVLDKAAPLS